MQAAYGSFSQRASAYLPHVRSHKRWPATSALGDPLPETNERTMCTCAKLGKTTDEGQNAKNLSTFQSGTCERPRDADVCVSYSRTSLAVLLLAVFISPGPEPLRHGPAPFPHDIDFFAHGQRASGCADLICRLVWSAVMSLFLPSLRFDKQGRYGRRSHDNCRTEPAISLIRS